MRLCWFPFCKTYEVCAWLHEESTWSSTAWDSSGLHWVRSWKSTPTIWYLCFSPKSYKSHFRSMIFIYFKGLMTKWTFLIEIIISLQEAAVPIQRNWSVQLSKKGFCMFYNPTLIKLWKFLWYAYPHFSLIDMCVFLALPDPTCYLKTSLSRAGFSFQHKKTLLTSFLNLLNRASDSSLSSQADNSAFCTLTLLSGGKMERLIMWTMW